MGCRSKLHLRVLLEDRLSGLKSFEKETRGGIRRIHKCSGLVVVFKDVLFIVKLMSFT